METLNFLLTIAKVAVGLGFVIFIHELGHFLLAKWNGVKVEKFSIGFGPTIFGWRRGETEYVLAALPLGGFVKMLGEGPEDQENKTTDPRAYPNKSVSARMAIISAGVIMNVFLAVACFVYYYGQERLEQPAVLGGVTAGSPAYEAGLRPGDEIVAIDERRNLDYLGLIEKVLFSSQGQVLHFEVRRPGHDGLIGVDIQPRREATGDRPTIGVLAGRSLEIGGFEPAAGMENPPVYHGLEAKERESKVDVLVAAGPTGKESVPLADKFEYDRELARNADQPITHMIERRPISPSRVHSAAVDRSELTLPANHFVDFGFHLAFEPIRAIRKDSPADKAGFRKGDLIVSVDGKDDVDPMQLPTDCLAKAGKPMTFEVQRDAGAGQRKTQSLTVTPDDTPPRTEFATPDIHEPVDVAGLGLCYPVSTRIVGVRPNSPASKAGLKPGDVLSALAIPPSKPQPTISGWKAWLPSFLGGAKVEQPKTFEFSEESPDWLAAFLYLQNLPLQEVELTVNRASKPIKITPEIDRSWHNPYRGLLFYPLVRMAPPQTLSAALRSGYEHTIQNILMVYGTFRSLAERRVSPKNLGGPILIAQVAYSAAGSGFAELIKFLGMLSINLAVLNFLPIPPLDGGQMLFLIAEKIRGRPLPDSALIAGTYVGLLLVLCLMVFVTYQDVFRLFTG
ncbi:MAG TPA: site-2 protease family protein [Isosphaeraceae bacterium]|nr:site-2 protease family protein [Isosphaeraceae bacterium]